MTNSQVGWPDTLRDTDLDNIYNPAWVWPGTVPQRDTADSVRFSGSYSVPVLGAVLYSLLGVDTSYFADYPSTSTLQRTFPECLRGTDIHRIPELSPRQSVRPEGPAVIQWNYSIDHNIG